MNFSRQNVESAFYTLQNGSNEEIKNVNLFLMEWAKTPECHQTAFEILSQSDNQQYINMALSILFRQIQAHWNNFDDIFRNSVKTFFFKLLSTEFPSPSIANTSISILVLIAIYEWPEIFPDFFDLIFNLSVNIYSFKVISSFLKFLEDCDFITRSRLASLRMFFINNNYIQRTIFLIQQTIQQQHDQVIIDQYTTIFLSIYSSLFEWCDINIFITQDIIYYIISKIPIQEAYDCLISLFITRTDSTEILLSVLPDLLPAISQTPNVNFLFPFLRKFSRILEKAESGIVSQLYSFLLTVEFDIEDLDDFWDLWYVIVHRLLFAVANQDEASISLIKIFSPLFNLMRSKFMSLIPLAISNGKIVDYTAISTWELLNRIDKVGFLNFFSDLQQSLFSEPQMRRKYSIDINYSIGSLNFLLKTTSNQDLFSLLVEYFTKLIQEGIENFDIQSSIFALSRSTVVLINHLPIFQKFCEYIMFCFKNGDLDLKETAANCFSYTIKEIPDYFASSSCEFAIFFLNSIRDLLSTIIEADIQDDSYVIMLFRCATYLASILSKRNEDTELIYFDMIADPILEILYESAPIALKIISEIGNSSGELCIFAFRKFWSPLFSMAKMNDTLINDMIIDALCAGFGNCQYDKIQPQIKLFIDLLLIEMDPEVAVAAISSCRKKNPSFDEFYPFFENLLNIPSVELFNMYFVFSPNLLKFDRAIPLICEGIIDVDIDTCNAAISCIKKFVNSIDEPFCQNLLVSYRKPIIHAIIQSLIDFLHCSLVSRLSSILIKIISVSQILNIQNVEVDIYSVLKTLYPIEPGENECEKFTKLLVATCNDREKANQVIADFLIIMRYATPTEKMEILNGVGEIDDEEKNIIDEIEKSLDIK